MEDSPFSPKSPEGIADEKDAIPVGATVVYKENPNKEYVVLDANYNTGKVFIQPKVLGKKQYTT